MTNLELLLLILLAGACIVILYGRNTLTTLQRLLAAKTNDYLTLLGQKKSSEVRTGQIAEQLAPFLETFGHDPKKAHFLGQPVDYIIFEENKIVFKEIKSGGAQLSPTQRKIKQLIFEKKVVWEEMRINGKSGSPQGPIEKNLS